MGNAYPKVKYRALGAGDVGDLRDPNSTVTQDRWPYVTTIVNSAAEEAALDPTLNWVDDASLIVNIPPEQSYP